MDTKDLWCERNDNMFMHHVEDEGVLHQTQKVWYIRDISKSLLYNSPWKQKCVLLKYGKLRRCTQVILFFFISTKLPVLYVEVISFSYKRVISNKY